MKKKEVKRGRKKWWKEKDKRREGKKRDKEGKREVVEKER